jgi:hypothetical protein
MCAAIKDCGTLVVIAPAQKSGQATIVSISKTKEATEV